MTEPALEITTEWDSGAIPSHLHAKTLDDFEFVSRRLWSGRPADAFRALERSIFAPGTYYHIARHEGHCVGFGIRKLVSISSYTALYRWMTAILPEYQGFGFDSSITKLDLTNLACKEGPKLYTTRTRNPLVWFSSQKKCCRVALDMISGNRDLELVALGEELASVLFPGNQYDTWNMTSKNVYYDGASYISLPHHNEEILDRAFYSHPAMSTERDSPFFVGEFRP